MTFDAQNKNSEYCAPLTSIAWNEIDPNLVGTSSIDTTCTIWDLTAEQAKTQLIAHDREVFDLAWAQGDNQKDCGHRDTSFVGANSPPATERAPAPRETRETQIQA